MATHELKRVISTPMLALYGIGNIVGAGVYVLIGKIAEPAGYLAVLAFLIAALVAFCAALSYAELAARFPVSAGVAVYLHKAFSLKHLSLSVGLMLVVAGTVSTATLLKGFAGYFTTLVPVPGWLAIIGMGSLLLFITLRGIKESVGTAALLTLVEIGGLLFLVASILIAQPDVINQYNAHFGHALDTMGAATLAGVISSSFIAFYAFVGFEDMVNVAEEVKKPQTAFPIAILLSMAVVTILYIAVAVVALGTLTPTELGQSEAPLATAYSYATGRDSTIIAAVSLVAALNGVIVNIVMGSRFLYGMARREWLHGWFGKVSGRHVPSHGLLAVSAVAIICALGLPIEWLANVSSFLLLAVFFAVNVSLIVIRKRTKLAQELRISPHFLPWVGAIASAGLLVGQIILTVL